MDKNQRQRKPKNVIIPNHTVFQNVQKVPLPIGNIQIFEELARQFF